MGRKKKKVEKPWCWYCNREFEDDKILIQHQKAKHFKCHICHKKLFSGPGLSIHCMQVHKESIDKVPCALPGRDNVQMEIYGMQGVPPLATRGAVGPDEPDAKRSRTEDTIPMPSSIPMPPMPGMPPFPPMGMPPFPGMMPGMPPMPPGMPPMPPGPGPYGMPPMPPMGMPPMPPGPRPPYGFPGGPPPGPHGGPMPPRSGFPQLPPKLPEPSAMTPSTPSSEPRERRSRFDDGPPIKEESPSSAPRKSRWSETPDDYGSSGSRDVKPPAPSSSSLPHVPPATASVASKLGARTRIIHPDDHFISLEERRASTYMNQQSYGGYH